jgi:hypothetical protein
MVLVSVCLSRRPADLKNSLASDVLRKMSLNVAQSPQLA